jgi:hypothetical protein
VEVNPPNVPVVVKLRNLFDDPAILPRAAWSVPEVSWVVPVGAEDLLEEPAIVLVVPESAPVAPNDLNLLPTPLTEPIVADRTPVDPWRDTCAAVPVIDPSCPVSTPELSWVMAPPIRLAEPETEPIAPVRAPEQAKFVQFDALEVITVRLFPNAPVEDIVLNRLDEPVIDPSCPVKVPVDAIALKRFEVPAILPITGASTPDVLCVTTPATREDEPTTSAEVPVSVPVVLCVTGPPADCTASSSDMDYTSSL